MRQNDSSSKESKNLAGQKKINLGILQHWSPRIPLTGDIARFVNQITGFYMDYVFNLSYEDWLRTIC